MCIQYMLIAFYNGKCRGSNKCWNIYTSVRDVLRLKAANMTGRIPALNVIWQTMIPCQ